MTDKTPPDAIQPANPNWRDAINPNGVSTLDGHHIEHGVAFAAKDGSVLIPTPMLRWRRVVISGLMGGPTLQQAYHRIGPMVENPNEIVWQDVPTVYE